MICWRSAVSIDLNEGVERKTGEDGISLNEAGCDNDDGAEEKSGMAPFEEQEAYRVNTVSPLPLFHRSTIPKDK